MIATLLAAASRSGSPEWSWDLRADYQLLTELPFMRNALWAGLAVAVMCALVGWFVVLRHETYVAHTLSLISFPGAAGAALLGFAPIVGYFAFALLGAVTINSLGNGRTRSSRASSAGVATVQAVALACGYLFVSLRRGGVASLSSYLFGSIVGITEGDLGILVATAVLAIGTLALIGRRLFFASVDGEVAVIAGVRPRRASLVFLLLLGLAVAEASAITGVLLVFALLVAPAAAASVLTPRPDRALLLGVVFGITITWAGLAAAFFTDRPVGFFTTSFGLALYLISRGIDATRRAWSTRGAAAGRGSQQQVVSGGHRHATESAR